MKLLHAVAVALGAALFAALVVRVGPEKLWQDAAALGVGVVVIVAIEGVADLVHTLAWRRCFQPAHRPPLFRLWLPHLAGAAINFVTPTATLGGEVVRGTLLPRHVPGTEATASLAINRLSATISDVLLSLAGVALLLAAVPLELGIRVSIVVALALFCLGVGGFFAVQRRGRLAALVGERRAIARVLGAPRAERIAGLAAQVDSRIAAFHAERPLDLVASVLLHTAANALGVVQLALFFFFLGEPVGIATLALVFLVARVLDLAAFLVPARLGVQEGARMVAMRLAGLDPSLGLLFSLVLRLEQVVWAGVGLAAYAALAAARGRRVETAS